VLPEIRDRYQQSYLAADIKQVKLGILLLTIPLVLFFYNDYLFFSLSFEFYLLTALRLGLIIYTVVFYEYLSRIKTSHQYFRSAFAWGLAGAAFQLAVNSSRPESFLFHVIMVIILIFANCLVIPQTFIRRLILSLTLTVGELAIIVIRIPSIAATALFSVIFTLVIANIIGLSMSRLMESYRVKAFVNHEELAENEKKYRELADSLPEIVFEANDKGSLTFVNRKALEILSYTLDEIKQMNFSQFLDVQDRQRAMEQIQKKMWGDAPNGSEYAIVRKDGSTFPGLILTERLIQKDGKFGLRGIIVNISEAKRTEQEVVVLNEKLRVVGSLTRHDVGNKLMAAKSNVYLLKKRLGDNVELAKYFDGIESAFAASDRIFEFSRLYEKIGAEKSSAENIFDCFNQAAALMMIVGSIKVVNECQGLEVEADSLLKQLFYNFIDNSLKHGEKVTKIRLHYTEDGNGLKLFYEDNGVGVPYANKSKLFEVGFTTGNGTGLGLYLVKKMMEVYGWTIAEEGEPGKGAKFVITIPKLKKNGEENYRIVP
jgi:PAS domain S-box-containing protein